MRNKIAYHIIRVLVGLMLIMSGAFKFFPTPMPPMPPAATAFMAGLTGSGYFLPFLGSLEVIIGILLLFSLWPAFSAVLLAPISLNIFVFEVAIRPDGFFVGIIFALLNVYLLYYHWDKYKPMFKK